MISASDQNPNIVVFFVDDMGYGEEDLQQHNSQLEARLAALEALLSKTEGVEVFADEAGALAK